MSWQPANLPYANDLESRVVLKALTTAHQALGQLKGLANPDRVRPAGADAQIPTNRRHIPESAFHRWRFDQARRTAQLLYQSFPDQCTDL